MQTPVSLLFPPAMETPWYCGDTHHEGLKVWPPKVSDRLSDAPVVDPSRPDAAVHRFVVLALDPLSRLVSGAGFRTEAEVHAVLQAVDLVLVRLEVVARQFEERVGDLEEQDVRVTVLVHDQQAFDRSPHAILFVFGLSARFPRRRRESVSGLVPTW